MCLNTELRLGAMTTPTNCDRLDSRLRRIGNDFLRLLSRQLFGSQQARRVAP